jgi:glucose/arabinose dehydrogenase
MFGQLAELGVVDGAVGVVDGVVVDGVVAAPDEELPEAALAIAAPPPASAAVAPRVARIVGSRLRIRITSSCFVCLVLTVKSARVRQLYEFPGSLLRTGRRYALAVGRERIRVVVLASIAFALLTGCGADAATTSDVSSGTGLVAIGAGLRGPAGLKATVFATGVKLMSAFAFDARGRLWVTASGATTHATDGLYIVPRSGARPERIAASFRGPLGLVWIGDRLYVSSLGRVDVLSGLHGVRFAARRKILAGPPGGGENNNIAETPAGRIVMGVSASCDHCTPASTWSGSIVEFKTDGSGLALFARRIRAPYGLVFYPGTGNLLASMNQRDDLAAKTPGDWLGYVRRGESWGFPQCYGQAGAACTGVPKPLAVLGKHAAAGGVAIVTSQLGATLGPSALVAEWALGKVLRVPLAAKGTRAGAPVPFLTGLQNPLPVAVAPDGAVLVGDWTSGRIYRIARR